MKQPEQAIAETLAALSQVEAPTHLEQRVLHRLAQREAALSQAAAADSPLHSPDWRRRSLWQRVTGLAAGAKHRALLLAGCTLGLVLLVITSRHRPHAPAGVAMAPVQPALSAGPSKLVPPAKPHPLGLGAGSRPLPVSLSPQRRVASPASRRKSTVLSVSYPHLSGSRPIPGVTAATLTPQERLLQQIARFGDPSQIAMLNPDVVAHQRAENDAEFRQFFAPQSIQKP